MRSNTLVLGLRVDSETLRKRISARIEGMVDNGLIDEISWAVEHHPAAKALDAPGYKAFRAYISGALTMSGAVDKFIQNDYQLSRRQMTWFGRNKSIHWLADPSEADDFVTTFLNKKQ